MRVWHSCYWPKFIFCSAFLSTELPHYKLWSTTCDKANRVPRICFADEVRDLLEVLFGIDNHWLWLVQLYWREHCVEIRHPVHHRDQSLQRSTREKRNAMKELEITRESSSTNTPPFCHFLISQIEACVDIFRSTLEAFRCDGSHLLWDCAVFLPLLQLRGCNSVSLAAILVGHSLHANNSTQSVYQCNLIPRTLRHLCATTPRSHQHFFVPPLWCHLTTKNTIHLKRANDVAWCSMFLSETSAPSWESLYTGSMYVQEATQGCFRLKTARVVFLHEHKAWIGLNCTGAWWLSFPLWNPRTVMRIHQRHQNIQLMQWRVLSG